MNEELNPKKEKKPFFTKAFWISLIISFVVALALTVIICIVRYISLKESQGFIPIFGILADGFFLSGFLLLLFFLLQWIATKGLFDILAYSIQVVFFTVFRPNYRKSGFPATYYEYKQLKDSENRKPILAILFVSVLFIVLGLILFIVYTIIDL